MNDKQIALSGSMTYLSNVGESITSLFEIANQYKRGLLKKPVHQRDYVWTDDKKRGWISRIMNGLKPVGIILTYQLLTGDPSKYLNDGFQRLQTTIELLDNPNKYGYSDKDVEFALLSCNMPIQHRHYKSHDEALIDFQQINLGTHLTPYEHCKGILTYMSNWETVDKMFERVFIEMLQNGARVVAQKRDSKREQEHKMRRSNYALVLRFLRNDKVIARNEYKFVRVGQVTGADVANKKVIEWKLREFLETKTLDEIKSGIELFISHVERETALIETIWFEKLAKERGSGLSITFYRWLIEASIWRRNNNIPINLWEKFVLEIIKSSNGSGQVYKKDLNGNLEYTWTLGLGTIENIYTLAEQSAGINFRDNDIGKRKASKTLSKKGYDNSHVLPFSEYGNGETFLEPASINRARGAKPANIACSGQERA